MPQVLDSARINQALADLMARVHEHRAAQTPATKKTTREALHQAIVTAIHAGAKQIKVAQIARLSQAQVSRVARGGSSGKTPLPPAQYLADTLPVDEIIDRYQAGESSRKLGTDFGCNPSTICRVLKSRGVPCDQPAGRPRVVLPDQELMERHDRGEPIRKIAQAYGVSHTTIMRRIRENQPTGRA